MSHKLIKVGSSLAVTIPAKDIKSQNLKAGDEIADFPVVKKQSVATEDQHILDSAKKILADYKQDFTNLADR